jgi:hypothetical protein
MQTTIVQGGGSIADKKIHQLVTVSHSYYIRIYVDEALEIAPQQPAIRIN